MDTDIVCHFAVIYRPRGHQALAIHLKNIDCLWDQIWPRCDQIRSHKQCIIGPKAVVNHQGYFAFPVPQPSNDTNKRIF
jgi:hypothetical protein